MRLNGFLNPRLGSLLRRGVWPPSKPNFIPFLALWPLWPFPAVLPFPDPIPRPFLVGCFLGTLSLKSFKLRRLYARKPWNSGNSLRLIVRWALGEWGSWKGWNWIEGYLRMGLLWFELLMIDVERTDNLRLIIFFYSKLSRTKKKVLISNGNSFLGEPKQDKIQCYKSHWERRHIIITDPNKAKSHEMKHKLPVKRKFMLHTKFKCQNMRPALHYNQNSNQ